jgi:hypothetical protein
VAKLVGIVLLVLGVAALAYRSFPLPGEKHEIRVGSLELAVEKKERVTVPTWAGVAAVGAGVALLVAGRRR